MSGLLKRIIVCLDVDDGHVVKGVQFVDLKKMGDPVELGKVYEDQGADELVFLDITASSDARPTALDMVRRVSKTLSIPFTVGGGLRTLDDVHAFLEAGADKIALNTQAVSDPELITRGARHFGSQCIVVAVDTKRDPDGVHRVYTHGGRRATGRGTETWAREIAARGAGELLLTSMDRDGTGLGFDLSVTGPLALELPIPVIASGGAQSPEHLKLAFDAGADAALAASMFHSGRTTIEETKRILAHAGIPVRWSGLSPAHFDPGKGGKIDRTQH